MSIVVLIGYIIVLVFVIMGGYCLYNWWCGDYDLKCILSGVDGNTYCIRERSKLTETKAVDLLATTIEKCNTVVERLIDKYPENPFCVQLKQNFNPKNIKESLPTSTLTAFTENKGESMSFCLNVDKQDNNKLIDENTLLFVALHELTHCGTSSVGHHPDFWNNFKFVLDEAKLLGIYHPVDYKNSPQQYCSMKLTDNPYYDLQKSKSP